MVKYMIHITYRDEDGYEHDAVYFGNDIDDIKSEIKEDAQYYREYNIEGIYELKLIQGDENTLPDAIWV